MATTKPAADKPVDTKPDETPEVVATEAVATETVAPETVEHVTEETAPAQPTPAMFEFVRVADKALGGAHRTVRRFVADNNPKRYQVLEGKPALDNRDRPLPAKPKN